MYYKRIASLSFGLAFICALFLFTDIGFGIISRNVALTLFIIFGGFGLIFNIVAFSVSKNKPSYNILFWIGSVVLFLGLIGRIMHWPYTFYLICGGTLISGLSFFYNPNQEDTDMKDDDLIDRF